MISKDDRVLVVVAHHDDETLGLGGLLHKIQRIGCNVTLCTFTGNGFHEHHIKATHALLDNIPYKLYVNLDYPDQILSTGKHSVFIDHLIETTKEFDPTVVLTHSSNEINSDHKTVHDVVKVAFRPFRNPKIRAILGFESLDGMGYPNSNLLNNSVFCQLSEDDIVMERKAIECYTTVNTSYRPTLPTPLSNCIGDLRRVHGGSIGVPYAIRLESIFQKF